MNWRPHNETQQDLDNETAAAKAIEAVWGCKILKLSPTLYNVDWAFFRDSELMGFGEFKRRSTKTDPVILSYAKFLRGTHLARSAGTVFILVIQFPDGRWYCTIKEDDTFPIMLDGSRRGQNGDMEPCVHIPLNRFKKLKNEDGSTV
mgnify:CR=1 FL=1